MTRPFWVAAAAAVALHITAAIDASAATAVGSGATPVCDRACMTGLVDRHPRRSGQARPGGPAAEPRCEVHREHGAAEGGVPKGCGSRHSEVPSGPKIYAVDVGAGQVGFYGVMKERDKPLIIALRLKVVNGQITEIEHVLARGMRPNAVTALATPRPEFVATLPAGRRSAPSADGQHRGQLFRSDRARRRQARAIRG